MYGKYAGTVNRVLLGLLMLIPGLVKLFVFKPSGVAGMLEGFGFPVASFFAWVLILSEIVFGIAILVRWKLDYSVWPPIVIMLVAAFTANWPSELSKAAPFLMHLLVASNYWILSKHAKAMSK